MTARYGLVAVWLLALSGCVGPGRISAGSDEAADTNASSDSNESGGASAESGASAGSTETGASSECTAILQAEGTVSGFELCPHDAIDRVSAQSCVDRLPPTIECPAGYGTCSSAADCIDQPYGACQVMGDLPPNCGCQYGCESDSDCGVGRACLCAPIDRGTICIDATCRTHADCPGGFACGLSPSHTWVDPVLRCHTPDDTCRGDEDCPEGRCIWKIESWACSG